jgi:ADP-heptose:LPS heptosyltransferase
MKKILIIKLGAKGDVVRTLPLARAIKEKYPECELYWLTNPNSVKILEYSKDIDKILVSPCNPGEDFDIVYNFDIDNEATDLMMKINAPKKLGFFNENGYPKAFNLGGEYYLNTVFDDDFKKQNRKTYQEMMFEVAELEKNNKNYLIELSSSEKKYAEDFLKLNKINPDTLLGIHIGASLRWPSKAWSESKVIELITRLSEKGYEFLLFAGPEEVEKQKNIIASLKSLGIKVPGNNPFNDDKEFFSLIDVCNHIICYDSFALHAALSLNKPTTALFFCTSPYEVEGYGLLNKVISPLLFDFFPEKSDIYDESLVNSISTNDVIDVLNIKSKKLKKKNTQ